MDNYQKLENLFEHARSQKASHSTINQTKDLFKNTVGQKAAMQLPKLNATSIISFKTLIIMSLLGIAVVCLLLFVPGADNANEEKNTPVAIELLKEKTSNIKSEPDTEIVRGFTEENDIYENVGRLPIKTLQVDEVFSLKNGFRPGLSNLQAIEDKKSIDKALPRNMFKEGYRFPVLTPEEIKANSKFKKKMIKRAYKKYGVYIPSGSFKHEGKIVSVSAFRMQSSEVANLEYRTFLFDLLIQGKKEDFLKAKPDQSKWTTVGGDMKAMQDMYFSHKAYDQYPVVNISVEGAEMYCAWLTNNLSKAYPNETFNDFRLPTKTEWIFAATEEGKSPIYPWGTDQIINESGCFLANFNVKAEDSTYWWKRQQSVQNPKEMNKECVVSDGALFTARTMTYNPNNFGLYNLSGNVAEIVYIGQSKKEAGTCGGGWMSSEDEIKLNATDPYKGNVQAHPNIGFRIIRTYTKSK